MAWVDTLLIFLVLTNLYLLGCRQVKSCIRVVAWQGGALGLLPVFTHAEVDLRLAALSAASVAIKGWLIPWLLLRARKRANIARAVEPYVSFNNSVLAGVVSFCLAIFISSKLPIVHLHLSPLAIPLAFNLIMVGFFIIVTRHKALTQVLGYLVLENGIYAFGVLVAPHTPVMIELALLLDVLCGVLIMGVTIFHISQTFEHIDVEKLTVLRD